MNNNLNQNINNYFSQFDKLYPHKTGLQNLGQTCYMNATIECLSNIKELTDYLLSQYGTYTPITNPLTTVYTNLICQLFTTNEKYISPNLFKTTIGKLNSLFKGMHAADSKDLLFFIIETLHKELTVKNINILMNINTQKNYYQLELEAQNEEIMFKNFLNDFNLKNQSILSQIFYGVMRSTMKCTQCKKTKYSFQAFNMQIFQLKKIKDDKKIEIGDSMYINGLNLFDAFYNQQKEEILYGDNMIYCNTCKRLTVGNHQQKLFILPKVLIIILNRGKNNLDYNEEFYFPDILDFKNKNIVINEYNHKYYLCGIITHLGESGSSGHFIAYCRNNSNSNFLCYNDAIFYEVDIKTAINSRISDKTWEKKTPYILFYHIFE